MESHGEIVGMVHFSTNAKAKAIWLAYIAKDVHFLFHGIIAHRLGTHGMHVIYHVNGKWQIWTKLVWYEDACSHHMSL